LSHPLIKRILRRLSLEYWRRVQIPGLRSSQNAYRFCSFPFSSLKPWRRKILNVVRHAALGDVLLCTPALREVKRRNPNGEVRFFTEYPELVRGLPYLDEVHHPRELATTERVIHLRYEEIIPPNRHIAKVFGDQLGVQVRDVRPDCVVDESLRAEFKTQFASLRRKIIVINRKAGPWTPNKDWPSQHWEMLVECLLSEFSIVEIGAFDATVVTPRSDNYIDLRGRTDLKNLVAVIAAADLHVGPISGPVHICASFRIPCVVLYGGYESPRCSGYSGNMNFATNLSCSPCWLRTPCPFNKLCLEQIRPQSVYEIVRTLLS
jgi:ADP-heptose:LPS heptosyltransferase